MFALQSAKFGGCGEDRQDDPIARMQFIDGTRNYESKWRGNHSREREKLSDESIGIISLFFLDGGSEGERNLYHSRRLSSIQLARSEVQVRSDEATSRDDGDSMFDNRWS